MTLLSLLAAILLEQFRPLSARHFIDEPIARIARELELRINDGAASRGTLAWVLAVAVPSALVAVAFALLYFLHPMAAFAFNVLTLYLCLGYRQHSRHYGRIHAALRAQDLARARELMTQWRGGQYAHTTADELARLAIEHALVVAHRQVFALFPLFLIFPGPSGVVLYRLAERFAVNWSEDREPSVASFGLFARRAFEIIDWLPTRMTAVAFSVMGDFEDAIYCWRTQSPLWPRRVDGVLIAAGAGALGVRLGDPVREGSELTERPEMGMGDLASIDYLYSAVGLIRRSLVLFLLLILLFGISGWAGG